MIGDFPREFSQDAAFFIAFVELELAVFVVQVYHAEGFDKKRRTGGGLVVDDGFDFAFEVRAEGDDVTTITGGDEVVLEVGGDVGVAQHALHPGEQAVVDDAEFAADLGEAGGGVVVDVAALGDDFGDGINQAGRLGEAAGDFGEGGELVLGAFKETGEFAGGDEGVFDIHDFRDGEDDTAQGGFGLLADVVCAADGGVGTGFEQAAGFGRFGLPAARGGEVGGGVEGAREVFRAAEGAAFGEPGEDFGVFEGVEGFGVQIVNC